ncbi:MAG: hypothetical protein HY973_03350 [Candidatus Kerfeldbacteria bacterium]|nr:hypothetical protein [Candidatus Kerfeldbacteria bacterium]
MENTLSIVLAVVSGLAIIGLAIYMIVSRNRAPRIENAATFGSCRTGYDVVFRVTSMPAIPAEARLVPRRNLCWIIPVLVALFFLMLFFVYLAARPSSVTTAPAAQVQNPPTPLNPPVPTLDPAKIIDPVNNKIDQSTQFLGGKIDSVNKNLTAHRESSKRGYKVQNEKLDKIAAGVDGNGKKLDDATARLAQIQAKIDLLVPQIDDARIKYENVLKSNNEDLKNTCRTILIGLNDKLDKLLSKKDMVKSGDTTGDPD